MESRLRAQFGDDVVSFEEQHGHSVVAVTPSRYRELVTFLRNEPEFDCDYCDFTSAVDFGEEGMEVVTHLFSTTHDHNVRVKVRLPADEIASWKARDPIARFEAHALGQGLLSPAEIGAMREGVAADLALAVAFAEASPFPDPKDLLVDMFAE